MPHAATLIAATDALFTLPTCSDLPTIKQWQFTPEFCGETNVTNTKQTERPDTSPPLQYRVPVKIVTARVGQPKTALAKSVLALGNGWALLLDPKGAATSSARTTPYLRTIRLHQDVLWNGTRGVLCSVVAFSAFCLGPPGWVHGGCMFAVLEDAMTRFVVDAPPTCAAGSGEPVMESMTVNYKGGAPIDAVHVIQCRSLGAAGDGASLMVQATLHPANSARDIDDLGERKGATAPFAVAEARFSTTRRLIAAL